jgi:membrane associated rhomboid family serine protease
MDDDGADTEQGTRARKANPRDGLIDFTAYSIEQLRDLRHSIDPDAFPENFKHLLAALEQKEELIAQLPLPPDAVAGRFTARNGLLGWIQARCSRSPVYGMGSLEVGPAEIFLSGWQRTWLGVPLETQVTLDLANVRNVVNDGTQVRFEIARKYRPANRICFQPDSPEDASRLLANLPGITTTGFLARWSAIREFNEKLRATGGRLLVTPVVVGLNVVVFAAMAFATKRLGQFTPQELLNWGANFGPLTVNGQWWRLFTALFVHFSLLHVLLNMWALWNVGSLTERLFGRGTLLFLYVAAGVLASLTSIAWDPSHSSVGASGAIFGVFGAFLAFLSRQRHQIPASIVRKHWISTSAFVLFNLVSGAIQAGIDNAAHVGGLLSGFALGFILARPLDPEIRRQFPMSQSVAAAAFIATVILAATWQVRGVGSGLTIPEQYFRKHSAYVSGEAKNLQLWNLLAQRASAGSISDAELAQRFEEGILPFWQSQKDQLEKENETLKGPERPFALLVAEFAQLRYEWASTVIDATKNNDRSRASDAIKLMVKTNAVSARLERLGIRARMDHRPRALATAPLVTKARQLLTGYYGSCVSAPAVFDPPIGDSDDKTDGPATRHAAGCRAQQLFMAGDYRRLDSLMRQYMGSLEDLPDGSSRYEGLTSGLTNLFRFGGLAPEIAFGHTADWRRSVKNSEMADLVEAMFFSEWAWSARGTGFANSISAQNLALYAYRTEMAAAALEEVADRASNNPLWYTLSLNVGLDQSKDRDQLQAIFDQAFARVPKYRPLYRRMLRILMPRWGGSYEDVDKFINRINAQTGKENDFQRYAELYSEYARMEGDELDLFSDTPAFWSGIRIGYLGLVKRYPRSDVVLNSYANFACRAGDMASYYRLRYAVGQRFSSTAWSPKYSKESCDQKLAASSELRGPPLPELATGDRIRSLGGLRLGMTRNELLSAKGHPIHQEETYWVYNTIDSSHNGVLTAVFSPPSHDSEGVVRAIEYTGDEMSAPGELPFLNELSSVKVIEMYGPQIDGRLTLSGRMLFKFRNGVYVDTRDEKVFRYGIFENNDSIPSAH